MVFKYFSHIDSSFEKKKKTQDTGGFDAFVLTRSFLLFHLCAFFVCLFAGINEVSTKVII